MAAMKQEEAVTSGAAAGRLGPERLRLALLVGALHPGDIIEAARRGGVALSVDALTEAIDGFGAEEE
jgi:hypothetical protein